VYDAGFQRTKFQAGNGSKLPRLKRPLGMSPPRTHEPTAKAAFRLALTFGIAAPIPRCKSRSPFPVCSNGRGILLGPGYAFLEGDRDVTPYLDREYDGGSQQERAYGHVCDGRHYHRKLRLHGVVSPGHAG